MQASGSVWNANSWHWEQKNYNIWARERITQLLKQLNFSVGSWVFSITEIKKLIGEASVIIRKGKSILIFEFQIQLAWQAVSGEDEGKGTFVVNEFNQEQIDDLEVSMNQQVLTPALQDQKGPIQRQCKKSIQNLLSGFFQQFKKLESDQKKLEEDKRRRIEEEKKREETKLENIQQHQKIIEESRALDQQRRQQAIKINTQNENYKQGQGSEWNMGSYFWEEKSVNWTTPRLMELLKDLVIPVPSGELKITEATLDGDCSVNIRKARKLHTYSYDIKLKWEGKLVDGENTVLVSCEGEVQFPDFSNDTEPDYDMYCTISTDNEGQDRLREFMNTLGKETILGRLRLFLEEFNKT